MFIFFFVTFNPNDLNILILKSLSLLPQVLPDNCISKSVKKHLLLLVIQCNIVAGNRIKWYFKYCSGTHDKKTKKKSFFAAGGIINLSFCVKTQLWLFIKFLSKMKTSGH